MKKIHLQKTLADHFSILNMRGGIHSEVWSIFRKFLMFTDNMPNAKNSA